MTPRIDAMKCFPLLCALFLTLAGLAAPGRAQERVLYEKESAFGWVIVTEERGLRTLRFEKDGARQSVVKVGDPDHLELAYAKVALTSLALCRGPERVLVVGHGAGTLPMFLRRHYSAATIDSVDINPAVVFVAKEYFGFREDTRMRAHVADGRAFIQENRQPYDLIILDAFDSESVPRALTTLEFLQAVRRALRPDGVVASNIWARPSNPLYDSMVRTYQEVFDDVYILPVQSTGNMILLALPRRLNLSRDDFALRASKVSTAKRLRFDLGAGVQRDFLHATEKNEAGLILRDADLPKP